MKKIITTFLLCFCFSLVLVGCTTTPNQTTKKLDTPSNIRIEYVDNKQQLLFDEVANANRYTATFYQNEQIVKEIQVSNANILDLEIGEYEVSIKALDTTYAFDASDASNKIAFIKETETKYFNFVLNSQGTEYLVSKSTSNVLPKHIIIPSEYNKLPVTGIMENGFEHTEIISIRLLDNIKLIGKQAFSYSSLQKIEFTDSILEIEREAFYSCLYLQSFDIPKSMSTIPFECFYKCASLKEITIPQNITTIEASAFNGCSGLGEALSIQNIINLLNNENINVTTDTLASMDLESLNEFLTENNAKSVLSFVKIYPSTNAKEIKYDVKLSTGLENLTIENADTLTYVGNDAFNSTPWFESHPIGLVYVGKVLYKVNGQIEGVVDYIKEDTISITNQVFFYQRGITKVVIPGSVNGISHTMFRQCINLEEIVIEEGVEFIDIQAFDGCGKLKTVYIPKSMKEIKEQAFINCRQLTNLILADNLELEHIGNDAFKNCSSLTSIKLPSTVTYVGSNAFSGCSNLTIYLTSEAPNTWNVSWNSSNRPVVIE